MRRKVTHSVEEAEVDLTPMLDIVFIMLIFFIVTTTFVKEHGLDMTRPENPDEPQSVNLTRPMRIIIDPQSQVLVDMRPVDPRAVQANIKTYLGENPEGAIVIQADKTAKTGVVITVLDQARQAGAPVSVKTSDMK